MAKESVDNLVQKAQLAVSQGHHEQARQFYRQALAVRSDLPNVHYGLATVCYLLNDLPSAAYHFKEVTRLDPVRAGAFINLGAVYNKLDQLDEAVAALRRGIQLDLNRAEGYYNLGLVYRRKGQIDLAIQAYRESTRVNANMPDAHYNLANLYLEKGNHALALMHYQLAVEHRPNWEKALHGLEHVRQMLQENESPQQQPIEREEADDNDEEPTQHILDPDRTVDPYDHGTQLTELHHAAKDAEQLSRDFVQLLQSGIEPAVKLLSNCLLHTNQSGGDLDQSVQKVEAALDQMNALDKKLEKSMERIRVAGEQLWQR
jgi:tetratricopeptide (TPR) repeat protein